MSTEFCPHPDWEKDLTSLYPKEAWVETPGFIVPTSRLGGSEPAGFGAGRGRLEVWIFLDSGPGFVVFFHQII